MTISLVTGQNSSTVSTEVASEVVLITFRKELNQPISEDISGTCFYSQTVFRNGFSCVHMGVFVLPVQAVHRVSGIQPAGKSL